MGQVNALPSTFVVLASSATAISGADILGRLNPQRQAVVLTKLAQSLRDTHRPPRLFMRPVESRILSLQKGTHRKPGPAFLRSMERFEPSLWISLHHYLELDIPKLTERLFDAEQRVLTERKKAQAWAAKNIDLLAKLAAIEAGTRSKAVTIPARQFRGALELIGVRAPEQEHLLAEAMQLSNELYVSLTASRMVLRDLEEKTRHDPLTACLTRQAFQDELFAKLKRLRQKSREPKTYVDWILMIDIDRFKRVNDKYGHAVGDRVLETVAHRLRTTISKRDLVSLFGGDEFQLFVSDTVGKTTNRGPMIADRLSRAINNAPVEIIDKDGHPRQIKVSISIGVARFVTLPDSEQPLTDNMAELKRALKLADDALYKAKKAGRNRYVVSPLENPKTE